MGARQVAQMQTLFGEIYAGISGPDDPPPACCTLESANAAGSAVWVQALAGTVNMGYPFAEEPLGLLGRRGVRCPPDTYLVEWAANEYATLGFGHITPRDHAFLVDQIFVRVLACDDAGYELSSSIEPLES
jgi:hypothetical protein